VKDYHVSPLGRMNAIGELVGQDVFPILEVGHHGLAIDLMRLEKEDIDDGKDSKRYHDSFEEVKEKEPQIT